MKEKNISSALTIGIMAMNELWAVLCAMQIKAKMKADCISTGLSFRRGPVYYSKLVSCWVCPQSLSKRNKTVVINFARIYLPLIIWYAMDWKSSTLQCAWSIADSPAWPTYFSLAQATEKEVCLQDVQGPVLSKYIFFHCLFYFFCIHIHSFDTKCCSSLLFLRGLLQK